MSDEVIEFQSFEQIQSRPDFDPDAAIDVETFEKIIGPYDLPHNVYCQMRRKEGRCNHEHMHGWVGRTHEGVEVLIGGKCASKYFNADKNFRREKRRVNDAITRRRYAERLSTHLANSLQLLSDIASAIADLNVFRHDFRELRDSLPSDVLRTLINRAKARDNKVEVEIEYREKDENGRTYTNWVPHTVGSIRGLTLWNIPLSELPDLTRQLNHLSDVLRTAQVSTSTPIKALKESVAAIDRLPELQIQVLEYQDSFRQFNSRQNFKVLCYLTRLHQQRDAIAHLMLTKYPDPNMPAADGHRAVVAMDNELRELFRNRNFRIRQP